MRLLTRALGLLMLLSLASMPARAADTVLDGLFDELKRAPDEATARDIENGIWLKWFESGDPEIDALMDIATAQRDVFDFAGALETLDRVIAADADYAEAWNQKATIHFFREEYEQSLEAVARKPWSWSRGTSAPWPGRVVIRLRQHETGAGAGRTCWRR